MRAFQTLTLEEMEEFLDATQLGEHTIKSMDFNEKNNEWTLGVSTPGWEGKDDNGPYTHDVDDEFTFSQESFQTDYPYTDDFDVLYREFLWAKGFMETYKFKVVREPQIMGSDVSERSTKD